jgi:hypothetical protein
MACPAEDQFYRPRTRCILEYPAGQISAQRTIRLQRGESEVYRADF